MGLVEGEAVGLGFLEVRGDGIELVGGEGLDAEVDGGEEAVAHFDDVSSVGIGNGDL